MVTDNPATVDPVGGIYGRGENVCVGRQSSLSEARTLVLMQGSPLGTLQVLPPQSSDAGVGPGLVLGFTH